MDYQCNLNTFQDETKIECHYSLNAMLYEPLCECQMTSVIPSCTIMLNVTNQQMAASEEQDHISNYEFQFDVLNLVWPVLPVC